MQFTCIQNSKPLRKPLCTITAVNVAHKFPSDLTHEKP